MQNVGRKAFMGATLPIAGLGVAAVKSAVDFDTAFVGVTKTVDGTEQQIATLRTGIREMAKQLPASATEIAGVAEAAGQLGIETDNVLDFTRVMVDLGETTNLTAEQAATSMARLANITGLPQDQFDELGSVLVDLGNNLATTEADVLEFGTRIAGAGKLAGLSEAQILAIGGAMSSVGVNAEAGGTAVQKALNTMVESVATGDDKLAVFAETAGMSAQQFAEAFRDDAGSAFTSFVEGLGAQGDAAFGTLEALGLQDQRLIRSFLSLGNAGDLLSDSMDLANNAFAENTALAAEAEKRYESTGAQFSMVKGRVMDVAIGLGDMLAPSLLKVIDFAARLGEKFQSLSPTTQKVILVIAGVAAVIGPLLIFLGFLASALSSIIAIAPLVGTAFTVMMGPVGLIILGIAALIAIGVLLVKNWDTIKAKSIQAWGKVKDFVGDALRFLLRLFLKWHPAGILISKWDEIKKIFSGAKEFFTDVGKNVMLGLIRGIASLKDKVTDTAKDSWTAVKDGAKEFFKIGSPSRLMEGFGENVMQGFQRGMERLQDVTLPNVRIQARGEFPSERRGPGRRGPDERGGQILVKFERGSVLVDATGQDAEGVGEGIARGLSKGIERRWARMVF